MTAMAINLHEFIEEFRHHAILDEIHPAAAVTIDRWLSDMHQVAADTHEVARLVRMINDKIAFERKWASR
jgi:hypothetical protein